MDLNRTLLVVSPRGRPPLDLVASCSAHLSHNRLSLILFLLQQYSLLLKAFTSQGQSELSLLMKIQEYCYDNIHFMKAFQKIVVLFYKSGCRGRRGSASGHSVQTIH